MHITVLYFAKLRDELGVSEERLPYTDAMTLADLRQQLCQRGEQWQRALGANNILGAVNQDLAPWHHDIHPGDEIAFFPPVTGG